MATSPAELAALATKYAGDALFESIHTADPGTTGANESTAPRVAVTLTTSGAVATVPAKSFTGGAASGAAKFVGLWSASTGGTFITGSALTGDQAFNAAGAYNVGSWTVTLS